MYTPGRSSWKPDLVQPLCVPQSHH